MYSWFNKHLKLGWPEPVVEEDFHRLTAGGTDRVGRSSIRNRQGVPNSNVACWPGGPPMRRVRSDALRPRDADSLRQYQDVVGSGVRAILRPAGPGPGGPALGARLATERRRIRARSTAC